MNNLVLWGISAAVYSVIWSGIVIFSRMDKPVSKMDKPVVPEKPILRFLGKGVLVIALLCMPININGTVFTVLGNAVNPEGSIYSLHSFYQKAGKHAVAIFPVFTIQEAGGSAVGGLGIITYQDAPHGVAFLFAGVALNQDGDDTVVGVGIAGHQKATYDTVLIIGGAVRQTAGRDAGVLCCAVVHQDGQRDAGLAAGIAVFQRSAKRAWLGLGLAGYQYGGTFAEADAGLAFFQRAGAKTRALGVWSKVVADKDQ